MLIELNARRHVSRIISTHATQRSSYESSEKSVASFYACLPHRSNEPQTQFQNNDLDPAINTSVLPHSYNPWSG